MDKRKAKHASLEPYLLLPPTIQDIEAFAQCLNTEDGETVIPAPAGWSKLRVDYRPVQRELQRLVAAWRQSGPNLSRLFAADPTLAKEANQFKAFLVPTKGSHGRLSFSWESDTLRPGHPLDTALGLFFAFLSNPYNLELCGPCKQCGRYFVRRTPRGRTYCSKICGLRSTARLATKKRRQRESAEKLKRVRQLTELWARSRRKGNWKDWVVGRYQDVTKHWITRAVNNGLLNEPPPSIM